MLVGDQHIRDADLREAVRIAGRAWWVFLVLGALWLVFAFLVLSFDYTTVLAVSIATGILFIAGGLFLILVAMVAPGWKWVYVVIAVLSIGAGLTALIWPEPTFLVLSTIFAWFLLIQGIFDVVVSIMGRDGHDLWWLTMTVGILEVLLGFWAIGYPGRSLVLMAVWIGAYALFRGIWLIVSAFQFRKLDEELSGTA